MAKRSLDAVLSAVPNANRWKLDREIDFEHRDDRGQAIPQHLGRIAESMIDWEGVIADHLGLSEPDRSDIREKNHNKPCLQRREALVIWKSGLGSGATYKALIEAFFKAGRLDCADVVCGLLKDNGASGDRINVQMSSECITFISSVKEVYQERRSNREKQWPPCHSDKLVRLEIIEREKGEGYSANTQRGREDKAVKRTPLAYGDLFKVESGKRPVRKVLVEGDAGIGKTTLCVAVSEDWANGKLFQQFELVLLLPLRMKAVASAGSLPELLKLLDPGSSQMLCDSVVKYLEGNKKGVLIIADGWDELTDSKRQEGSFLYQLLFYSVISVIVTSRPSASATLHQLPCIDRFAEVRGFSKEHIVEYIKSEFASDQEKAGRLLEQLEYNPLVESVCSVPLNCAIVCHLWRTLEEALPTTMTELYTKIIHSIILRNIRKIDTYKSVLSLPKFESLPADLQPSWWLLCEFAFQALEKDQLIFSQEELEAFLPEGLALDERILCFGLLQSAESIGLGISFHFLHLTFQEYLAALHLARQTPDKQLEVFQSHKTKNRYSPNRFIMVWKFFFGIISSLEFNRDTNSFIQQILKCVAGEGLSQDNMSLCHCAFEANNDLINNKVTQYLTRYSYHKVEFGYPHTAHDCSAILHVIANMQECEGMEINFGSNCGVKDNQIKKLKNILVDKKGRLHIKRLYLSGSRLTVPGLQALENAVCGDLLLTLEYLNLAGSLSSDADTNAAWLTTFGDALITHCPHLQGLDLSNNNLGIPSVSALSRICGHLTCSNHEITGIMLYNLGIPVHVSALLRICGHFTCSDHKNTGIYLNRTNLNSKCLTILIKNLKVVSELLLVGNDIDASGVSCLADAICSGEIMITDSLNLSGNQLGLEGTLVIGRMFSSSHRRLSCKYFYLSKCELTTALPNIDSLNLCNTLSCEGIGRQFYQMPQNSTITLLFLNGNSFTGEGIHILAGFMHLCLCLNDLHTTDCGITSDDLVWLLKKLKSSSPGLCSKLRSWNLKKNQIDDRGVSALMDHLLSLFPRLWCATYGINDITNNPVSSEMMKRLEEELRKRQEHFKSQRMSSLPVPQAPLPLPSSQPSRRPVLQAPSPLPSSQPSRRPVPQAPSPLPSSQPSRRPVPQAPSPLPSSQPSRRPVLQAPSPLPSSQPSRRPVLQAPSPLPSSQTSRRPVLQAPSPQPSKQTRSCVVL